MDLKLTVYEQEMLDGKYGEAKQLAMEVLVKIAKALGAEEMVEIVSSQAMAHFGSLHIAGRDWLGKLAELGGKCCVPTTQDPASIPFDYWEEMGFDKEYAENQFKLKDSIIKLGEMPYWSCTPYNQRSVPRFNQNVAWAESSAVIYANSVLGARTDRTPAGLAVCAALTGRMPKFGLYKDENRFAQVKINIDAGELSDLDYNTIGIIIGRKVGTYIPAIYGLDKNATNDNLKYMGASAAASGSVALFHAIGVTPETFMINDIFGGKEPIFEFTIDRDLINETERSLTTKNSKDVGLVTVGCPHASDSEVIKIANLIEGKRVQEGKAFWIFTTKETEDLVNRMGLGKVLKDAGVTILAQTCLVISPLVGNYKNLMTNSGKFASYLPSEHNVELRYGSIEDCVEAVTK